MKNKLLFDYYQRMIIIDFYKKYPNWKYSKPLTVSIYEITKAKKDLQLQIDKEINKAIEFIAKTIKFLKGKTFTLLS
ncbi:hypothetical protein [Flavobacterium oncorhynchi]|nr:hypothetical protein [Flavobacterium oncorhynchi]